MNERDGTVWKFVWPLPRDEHEFDMPAGAELLHVSAQDNDLCIWARVHPGASVTKRRFLLAGTGLPAPTGKYIGTALLMAGTLVLHVFEQPQRSPM